MECIFCKIANNEITPDYVYEGKEVIAFLDSDPINEGHILIIPKRHYVDVEEIPIELLADIMQLSQKLVTVIKKVYAPDGYSIMQNGGEFNDIGHYHLHVFPRYRNDGFGWTYSNEKFAVTKEIANKIKNIL